MYDDMTQHHCCRNLVVKYRQTFTSINPCFRKVVFERNYIILYVNQFFLSCAGNMSDIIGSSSKWVNYKVKLSTSWISMKRVVISDTRLVMWETNSYTKGDDNIAPSRISLSSGNISVLHCWILSHQSMRRLQKPFITCLQAITVVSGFAISYLLGWNDQIC